jgi:hypothetical protein
LWHCISQPSLIKTTSPVLLTGSLCMGTIPHCIDSRPERVGVLIQINPGDSLMREFTTCPRPRLVTLEFLNILLPLTPSLPCLLLILFHPPNFHLVFREVPHAILLHSARFYSKFTSLDSSSSFHYTIYVHALSTLS